MVLDELSRDIDHHLLEATGEGVGRLIISGDGRPSSRPTGSPSVIPMSSGMVTGSSPPPASTPKLFDADIVVGVVKFPVPEVEGVTAGAAPWTMSTPSAPFWHSTVAEVAKIIIERGRRPGGGGTFDATRIAFIRTTYEPKSYRERLLERGYASSPRVVAPTNGSESRSVLH
jgi:hypothetical protein